MKHEQKVDGKPVTCVLPGCTGELLGRAGNLETTSSTRACGSLNAFMKGGRGESVYRVGTIYSAEGLIYAHHELWNELSVPLIYTVVCFAGVKGEKEIREKRPIDGELESVLF